jgi:hypothetical protein
VRTPRRKREYDLLRRYGITVAEYERMRDQQGGKCAICGRRPRYRLHVDHDHDSGEVRGLLCVPCNRAVGCLGDDPQRCLRAAEYLS